MNSCIFLALFLASTASATLIISTTATATALTATQAASIIAGVGLIKAVAIGTVAGAALLASAARGGRGRREAETFNLNEENDAVFNIIKGSEPHECVQRLICDMATGLMPPSDNDIIMSLFESPEQVSESSSMFKFAQAAKLGKINRDIQKCELQYTCPIDGFEIEQILNF